MRSLLSVLMLGLVALGLVGWIPANADTTVVNPDAGPEVPDLELEPVDIGSVDLENTGPLVGLDLILVGFCSHDFDDGFIDDPIPSLTQSTRTSGSDAGYNAKTYESYDAHTQTATYGELHGRDVDC